MKQVEFMERFPWLASPSELEVARERIRRRRRERAEFARRRQYGLRQRHRDKLAKLQQRRDTEITPNT